jgi:hypothetical protein
MIWAIATAQGGRAVVVGREGRLPDKDVESPGTGR